MNARLRSMTGGGSLLVLAAVVLVSGCPQKGPARPHATPVLLPPALQTLIAIDKDGNQIVVGSFTGRISVAGTSLQSEGGRDIFVVKTDKAGAALFPPKRFGGKDDDFVTSVAAAQDGSIVIAGTFQSAARFGDKTVDAPKETPSELRMVFVAKLDNKGDVLWVKRREVVYALTQISVAIDAKGNIVVGSSGKVPPRGAAASATGLSAKTADALKAAGGSTEAAGESVSLTSLSPDTGEPSSDQPTSLMLLSDPFPCEHSLCQGDWSSPPLTAGCGMYTCTATICLSYEDPYCCSTHWDPICVSEVTSICHRRCDCAEICFKGDPFYPDACETARTVINNDPACGYYWGSNCTRLAGCP